MSDGISDGNAVSELASSVENRAWDLVAAIYRARWGYASLYCAKRIQKTSRRTG